MKQYSSFLFTGYSWNHHAGKISLRYSLDHSIDFEETILLPEPVSDERLKAREWEIERALAALHLIGGISYYKTCLPRKIEIPEGTLSKQEAKFWNMVYERGLGEFFYRNDIDFRGLVNFPVNEQPLAENKLNRLKPKTKNQKPISEQRILVPIGGGKDSLVTIELLKKAGAKVTLLRMGSHPLIDELAHVTGLPMITVRRSLSGNLFDLNEEGALNGHVPITAYLSILSLLLAELYAFDTVVMSNEASASIGNIEFKGTEINHQWSKSLEFEKMLRSYARETIGTNVEYFSLLRPFSELKIAEIFSHSPQYFEHFTSCNTNWKILSLTPACRQAGLPPLPARTESVRSGGPEGEGLHREDGAAMNRSGATGSWCGNCPKCAFVFSALAAFLPRQTLEQIFGKILYDDATLLPLFRELLGQEKFKPFECVGTPDETKAAFLLARKRGDLRDTAAMKMFEAEILPTINDPEKLIEDCLKPNTKHCLPKEFVSLVS